MTQIPVLTYFLLVIVMLSIFATVDLQQSCETLDNKRFILSANTVLKDGFIIFVRDVRSLLVCLVYYATNSNCASANYHRAKSACIHYFWGIDAVVRPNKGQSGSMPCSYVIVYWD